MNKMDNYINFYKKPKLFNPNNIAYIYNHFPLITIKADGIFKELLLNENNFYPNISKEHNIKSLIGEFYNDSNLLLVFGIKFNNDDILTIYDMNLFLDKLYNNNLFNYGSSIIDQIDERINLINNLKKNINNNGIINWFPKGYFSISNYISSNYFSQESFNDFINNLYTVFNHLIKLNDNKILLNDGLIITPNKAHQKNMFNIKIKPLKYLTIDINITFQFNNKKYKYLTGDHIDVSKYIYEKKNIKLNYNKIYRCYPIYVDKKLFFEPIEIRYDKFKANNFDIINEYIYLINNYFNIINLKNFYISPWYINKNNNYNDYMINIIDYCNYYRKSIINHINGLFFNVLDIGCGNFKTFTNLLTNNNHNIDYYIGLDIDLSILYKAKKNKNNKNNINKCEFLYYDINKSILENYNNHLILTYYIDIFKDAFYNNKKYNYILSFFSLSYIDDIKKFINFINSITISGSYWIIQNLDSDRLKEKSNIYEINDNKIIIKLPCLKNYHIENKFSFNNFIEIIKEDWNIIKQYINNETENDYIYSINTLCIQKK